MAVPAFHTKKPKTQLIIKRAAIINNIRFIFLKIVICIRKKWCQRIGISDHFCKCFFTWKNKKPATNAAGLFLFFYHALYITPNRRTAENE